MSDNKNNMLVLESFLPYRLSFLTNIISRKLARLYSPWMHIGSLPAGETTVSVSLNANDHSPLSVGDTPLSADVVIQVQ